MVSLSCWAEQPNCVPAPYSGDVTSRTRQNRSQSDAPGPKTWHLVYLERLARCPGTEDRQGTADLAALETPEGVVSRGPGPGLVRAGPSGEERCTPHYTVPVSPQCPQEISLLTLPVFQGAAVSSERFSQSLPPRNVAELGGSPPLRGVSRAARSAVLCRSSVPGHRASRSKYIRGQSQETGSLSKSSGGVGALAKRVLLGPA